MNKKLVISCLWNLLFLAGAALVSFGLWLAWHPLGFIAAGLVLAILGYGGGFEQARKAQRR